MVFALAGRASADITLVSDLSDPRSESYDTTFKAYVKLQATADGNSELTIDLVNTTTSSSPGGYITGLAFSTPSGATFIADSYKTTNSNFLLTSDSVATPPFSDQDLGAALGGSWIGGGGPNKGIAWSSAGTNHVVFTFDFLGTSLTEDMFKTAFEGTSTDPGFLVRFKGLTNNGSNKVPGTLVPEPTSAILLGLGLAGMAAFGLRRRRFPASATA